jgi:hypothetical protein
VTGYHQRDLERPEAGGRQVVHRSPGDHVRPFAAHGVVGRGVDPVEADLHVEVVGCRQTSRHAGVDECAVRGELDAHPAGHAVVDDVEEVATDRRLAAADVDVEDLHPAQLVDECLGLVGGQLPRVTPA